MRRKPSTLAGSLLLMCAFAAAETAGAARPAAYLRGFARTRAVIETSGPACLVLQIYLADSPDQQRQGLMFIDRLEEFEGMLFRYDRPATISMWMKNTRIPLDMVFIRADGEIAGIARSTTPMSTKRITSPDAVTFVLELNGGAAERWRIEPGNRLLTLN
ncbi:MAG: DUF192 domain-containing protein [Gammaproteobacteria bacterium]